jgi:hypothetical protein
MKPPARSQYKSEASASSTGAGEVRLLFLNYLAANMYHWDPKVTDGFAAEREVILFDNAGVESSTGETPSTVTAMMKD